ncbi:unnamed protein product [Penicillium discolor]
MYSTLLGSYEETNYPDLIYLREGCPYGRPIDVFDYYGACTHTAFREVICLLNRQRPSDVKGNKDVLKLLGGDKPIALEDNEDDPSYTMDYWSNGMNMQSTYHLQAVGKKQTYGSTMNEYSTMDTILDIDSILGIERDEPVLSKIPQREIPTEIPEGPEGPERRKATVARRTTEAAKAGHKEQTRTWSQRPEVKDRRKAKYLEKKNTSTEEEKDKARKWHNHIVKKKKDEVHMAVYGTTRRQQRPATELVLQERAA